ncbi:hypothetical protein BC829DRAFT_395560 [Chytridium lagenaria]|nr:hypothetical protein BC829DRAFT_395560 [Chytridium lagenaria]
MSERKSSVNQGAIGKNMNNNELEFDDSTPPSLDRHVDDGKNGLLGMAERKASVNSAEEGGILDDFDMDMDTPPSLDRHIDEERDGLLSVAERKASVFHGDDGELINDDDLSFGDATPAPLDRHADDGIDGLLSMAERTASVHMGNSDVSDVNASETLGEGPESDDELLRKAEEAAKRRWGL